MNTKIQNHFIHVLKHLYINPLEKCNLRCKICYTRKTDPILKEKEILEFIERYEKALFCLDKSSIPNFSDTPPYGHNVSNGPINTSLQKQSNFGRGRSSKLVSSDLSYHSGLESVTFCGGEVFTLQYFTSMLNKLTGQGIFVQIITNGTIDKLDEFENPNMVNMIVSIDGLRDYHDKNRGEGNFDKSIKYLLKARRLGFHTEIFSIVTKQNIYRIEEFENYINKVVSNSSTIGGVMASAKLQPATPEVSLPLSKQTVIPITYHPRKPPSYLMHHPISNIRGITDGFDFLDKDELILLMRERKTFPPINLGCFQISLASDGKVYGCCEGTVPIGKIDDKIEDLFDRLKKRLEIWDKENPPVGGLRKCLGCSQPDFVCGIKSMIS